MKVVTGYSYRCPKCGAQLYSENLDMAAKQVLIGEMIKPCVKCGNINRTNKVEYFKTNKNAYMSFYTANFVLVQLMVGMAIFCILFFWWPGFFLGIVLDIIFSILHFKKLGKEYDKKVLESKERLKDVDYLKSLIEYNLISNNEFNILLNDNVIDSKTYNKLTK